MKKSFPTVNKPILNLKPVIASESSSITASSNGIIPRTSLAFNFDYVNIY